VGAFVESSEQRVVIDDIPDAIVHLLEPDRFAVERLTRQVLAEGETERTGVADAANLEVARILRRGDAFGIRTRGPAGGRRFVVERFVGPRLIVCPLKRVEHTLLRIAIGGGGPSGAGFEGAVQPFEGAVFVGTPRDDALVGDAWLKPPHIEAVEPVNAGGGKWRAVVSADRLGQSGGPKELAEVRFHRRPADVREPLAAEQVAAEVIDDRQRVATDPVPHPEMALEIDRPDLVRADRRDRHPAGMFPGVPAAMADPVVPPEDVKDGAPRPQAPPNLAGPPPESGMFPQNQCDEVVGRSVWR